MWETKQFKTKAAMNEWLSKHSGNIQYIELFINNLYGIRYRKLRLVY